MKGLFTLNRDVVLSGDKYTLISLSDKDMFQKYLDETTYEWNLWSTYFSYFYCFGESSVRRVVWKIIDEMLCVFYLDKEDEMSMLALPLGKCDKKHLNKVLFKCFKLMKAHNKTREPKVRTVTDLQSDWLSKKLFHIKKNGFGQEHIYPTQRVCEMQGKEFAYIRRKINKFTKEYPNAIWREYDSIRDYDKMMTLKKEWEDTAGEKYFRIIDATNYKSILHDHKKLDHKVFVVEIAGKIVGMISGQYLTTDKKKAVCFLRKPLNHIQGLSEYLIYKLCCELNESEVLNDGGDGNAQGLRFFKERFSPVASPFIYEVSLSKDVSK